MLVKMRSLSSKPPCDVFAAAWAGAVLNARNNLCSDMLLLNRYRGLAVLLRGAVHEVAHPTMLLPAVCLLANSMFVVQCR